jgi:hypothetical protein
MKPLLKTLMIAALLAASFGAQAGDMFYAPNSAGGLVTLTDNSRGCPAGTRYYYTTASNGAVGDAGCWRPSDPWVIATANDGTVRRWPMGQFQITDYGRSVLH